MGWRELVLQQGFAVVEDVLAPDVQCSLLTALAQVESHATRQRQGSSYAMRDLLARVPEVQALVRSPALRALVEPLLGPDCFAVRGLLFDKTPTANWKVGWHQDLTIAVQAQTAVPGFGPWSKKAGVVHVQPPASLLEKMLAVRVHLDACGVENGPVRVLPGSHQAGRLTSEAIAQWCLHTAPALCTCRQGGVLLMRPLLLHASSPASQPSHRRVLHLEFATDELPAGLAWYERW